MLSNFSRRQLRCSLPLVSVIVPTFQSGSTLDACLDSIRRQTYQKIELILVDAYSSDNTCSIGKNHGARLIQVAAERCTARNLGVKVSKGVFVFFVDSDMELTPKVVEESLEICLNRNVSAVIIPEESVGDSFLARCKKLEKSMRQHETYGEAPRLFKRSVFDFLGGYSEDLVIGEDFELAHRLRKCGFQIGRIKSIIKHHEENVSMKKLTAKLYYYGKTLPNYVRKAPSLTVKTSSPIRFFRNLSLLKQQPTCFAGLCSLKFVEYSAYLTGAVFSFL